MKKKIINVLFLVIVLLLSAIPFYNMLVKGIFSWHVQQPEFIEGGITLCLAILISLFMWWILQHRIVLATGLVAILYLLNNGVFLPVIAVLSYFFALYIIGSLFDYKTEENSGLNIVNTFVYGITIWGAGAILLSLLGKGTINALRIYTICLLFVALIVKCRKGEKQKRTTINILDYRLDSFVNSFFIILMVFIVCALCAKTNTAQDYDSLWYGLRPQYALVGENSFFDDLGYLSFVYYYPKMAELLYLPLSGYEDYSFLQCANIGMLVLFLIVVYEILNICVKNSSFTFKLSIVTVFCAIPAIANISATTKSDVFGLMLICLAFIECQQFLENGEKNHLFNSFLALMLCTGTRLTDLLWGGILFIWIIWTLICKEKKQFFRIILETVKQNAVLCVLGVFFIVGIHFRTFKLTGYFVYPVVVTIWNSLFGTAKPYMLTQTNSSRVVITMDGILSRLYEFVFNPTNLPHVIMLWTSNVLLITVAAFIIYRKRKIKSRDYVLFFLMFLPCLYYMICMGNPDGNYFLVPIVICSLVLLKNMAMNEKGYIVNNIVIALFLIPIMFVSHSSWAWGTQAFSSEVVRNEFDTVQTNEQVFSFYGIENIADEVENYSVYDKVISSSSSDGTYYRLPCNLEPYGDIANPDFTNADITSYDKFEEVVSYLDVKAFIVDKKDESEFGMYVSQYLENNPACYTIEDEGAFCYVLK